MAYSLLLDQVDGWVDRSKVKDRVDTILAAASGDTSPAARSEEAAMLALAGMTP